MMKSFFLAAQVSIAALLLGTSSAMAQRRFELADIVKAVGVSDPQLSPDG
jgi:hypothetical protein